MVEPPPLTTTSTSWRSSGSQVFRILGVASWLVLFLYWSSQSLHDVSMKQASNELWRYVEPVLVEVNKLQESLSEMATGLASNETISTSTAKLFNDDQYNASSSSACFPYNSDAWLIGPRLGNIRDLSMLDMDILPRRHNANNNDPQSPSYLQSLLEQSLCSKGSRFKTMNQDESTPIVEITNATVHIWTMRLVYWSMQYHQTRHARLEARDRLQLRGGPEACPRTHINAAPGYDTVGPYDYECPNAKFIIAPLASIGLGAQVRSGMVVGYNLGLVSDRVVIWVNESPVGDRHLRATWGLVSCDDDYDANGQIRPDKLNSSSAHRIPRRDTQCILLPSTPCVLTEADVQNAYLLSDQDRRQLLGDGTPPADHEDDKVWYWRPQFLPLIQTPRIVAERLRNYSHHLIQEHFSTGDDSAPLSPSQQQLQRLLYMAADNLLIPQERRPKYNYAVADVKISHALAVFALRLRRDKARKTEEILKSLVEINQIEPENSFGLPVRASDKCSWESECLTLEQHLEATRLTWNAHLHATDTRSQSLAKPSIIFTTESPGVILEQVAFAANNSDYPFRFATNPHDVTPGTGLIRLAVTNATEDESLFSALTSLQYQLLARVSLANCCSNFHTLLGDLMAAGCGAASSNTFTCFQEMEDPRYMICCGWFKNCKADKLRNIAALEAKENQSLADAGR